KKEKHIVKKLKNIQLALLELIKTYKQDMICREKGFYRFAVTTQKLFKVVGTSDLNAYDCGYSEEIPEYSPTTVKKHLTSSGKAEKDSVELSVRGDLIEEQENFEFTTNDISDAVAVGITHLLLSGIKLIRR
ncbi:crossover junction endodeoxyribonuclease RuvC, partial [Clostridium perfringens]